MYFCNRFFSNEMSKIKVVHIVEALGGGVYTYFKNLTHFFGSEEVTKEIETIIIYSSKRKEIDPENIKKDFSENVTLIEIDMVRELSPIQDFRSALQLKKLLKELNPDLVHLHSSKAGVLGRFANSLLFSNKKQIFYTPHGYSFLRLDVSQTKRKLYRFIEKYSQRLFGGITIACGDTEYEIAQGLGKSLLVRNGINIKNIALFPEKKENDRLTIGTIGRIMAQKNPKLFNDIAFLFPQYDFVWIGDGEDRELLTASNIRITGWFTDNTEVFPLLNQLDVYLQTSLWEGLPIAVLEAMTCKKPIVATNVIGNKDLVVEGENGFLFNDINQLDVVFNQLNNKPFRNRLGQKSFEYCKEKFNSDINYRELIEIYKRSL
jgi:glycosyltransferase involved in cell wall biosynthesis